MSRRDLFRSSLRAGAALALTELAAPVFAQPRQGGPEAARAVVAQVSSPSWRDEQGRVNPKAVRQMVDEAVKLLTGKAGASDAWRCFVSARERVAIKFNVMSLDFMRANAAMRDAIVQGLLDSGVPLRNITVVEDYGNQPLAGCWEPDFAPCGPEIEVHDRKTRLTRFIAAQADCVINVPDLKHHHLCGLTCALKNMSHSPAVMFGPEYMHQNCCDPYIAAMNALKPIREKRRLNICAAFKGLAAGGPTPRDPADQWDLHCVIASADPVALDRVALEHLRQARAARRLPELFRTASRPTYIATAAKMGLGKDRLEEIEIRKANL